MNIMIISHTSALQPKILDGSMAIGDFAAHRSAVCVRACYQPKGNQ